MKTEYVQTDFAEITPTIKRAWEIKSHARGKRLIPLARGEKPPQEDEARVTLNTATAEELESVCGLGEELASAVVRYREAHGPYREALDLRPIPGIGQSTAEKLWEQAGE